MKKLTALLLCLAFVLSLSACGKSAQPEQKDTADASAQSSTSSAAPQAAEDEEDEFAALKGYNLKVAFPENNAPFSYVDESGEVVGVDVDIARAVCEQRGWTLSAQATDWSSSEARTAKLASGDVDCIWGSIPFNDVNESEYLWNSYGSIYVDATVLDGAGINKLDDLKGKTVEVEPGSMFALEGESATELGKHLKEIAGKVEQVSDAQTAYQDLADGKCDAIVVSGSSDDKVVFDDFEVSFMAIYDTDVYSESEDSSDGELVEVDSNSICDLELGAGFAEDNDVYYAAATTMDMLIADGTVTGILDDWSKKDNGAYAEAVGRCTLYQVEDFGGAEDAEADADGSIDWSELEDWDSDESADDASVADITVDESTKSAKG